MTSPFQSGFQSGLETFPRPIAQFRREAHQWLDFGVHLPQLAVGAGQHGIDGLIELLDFLLLAISRM